MQFNQLRYFYIFSLFLIFFSPLKASQDGDDEDYRNIHNIVPPPQESGYMGTLQLLTKQKNNNMQPLENSLQIMRADLNHIIATDLVPIQEMSGMQDAIHRTKEKSHRIHSNLKDIQRDLQTQIPQMNRNTRPGVIKTLGELDSFLAGMEVPVNSVLSESGLQSLLHTKLTQSPPSFNVGYSGNTNSSGGSASYSGSVSVGTEWKCRSCNYMNLDDIKHYDYGPKFDRKTNYCGHCSHSRSGYYSGYEYQNTRYVSYSGTTYANSQSVYYSGSHSVTCNQNHHKCMCDKFSILIVSFRAVVEGKDYYQMMADKNKEMLQNMKKKYEEVVEDVTEMGPEIETIQGKGQLALSTIENDRRLLLGGLKSQNDKMTFAFGVMNQLHESEQDYQRQLLSLAKNNEEEQRNEKSRLQEEIEKSRDRHQQEIEDIMTRQKEINQGILSESRDKEKRLADKDATILDLLTGKHRLEIDFIKEREELKNSIKGKEFDQKLAQKDAEQKQALLEENLRTLIPDLFAKLGRKSSMPEEKINEVLDEWMNEELSLTELIKKTRMRTMRM